MPRLPSTSWAPRPTSASRTRVFTGRDSGSQDRRRAAGRSTAGEERGAPSGAEVSGPDSDWRRHAAGRRGSALRGAPSSPPRAYVYQPDRLVQCDVPHSGTAGELRLQDVVADGRPGDETPGDEERRTDDHGHAEPAGEGRGTGVVVPRQADRHGQGG